MQYYTYEANKQHMENNMTPQELRQILAAVKQSDCDTFYLKTNEFTILVSGGNIPVSDIKKIGDETTYDIQDKDMEEFYGIEES